MTFLRQICAVTAALAACLAADSYAGAQKDLKGALTIRAGNHTDYYRVVLEGPQSLLSAAAVSRNNSGAAVSFGGKGIIVSENTAPDRVKAQKNSIAVVFDKPGRLKSFHLRDPDRLVIDLYRKKRAVQKKTLAREAAPEESKPEQRKAPLPGQNKPERAGESRPGPVQEVAAPVQSSLPEDKEVAAMDEGSVIPEGYKPMWTLLESGNFYAVLKELPDYKSSDPSLFAPYYYILAKAYIRAKKYHDAVKYLRLAYIYAADDDPIKEFALMTRAGIYRDLKFVYEAKADYLTFLEKFPDSAMKQKANLGLARSLYDIGTYNKAIRYFRKAGTDVETLFWLGNALQRMDKVNEARDVYDQGLAKDKKYPVLSPETNYLIGQNLFMGGDSAAARRHLAQIDYGPYESEVNITLGLIALKESQNEEAVRKFQSAARSMDQKVKVRAVFNLALAHIKEGKFEEAVKRLEDIRTNHYESQVYKDTLLVLAKLYKKEGNIRKSVSLLKELVYGKQPPRDAFSELEKIVLEAKRQPGDSDISLVQLWNEVGQWLIDERRESFLITVAKRLRHDGKPFIDLCTWLVDNASKPTRGKAALELADYYAGIGNAGMSDSYLALVKKTGTAGDAVARIEAKLLYLKEMHTEALKTAMKISNVQEQDISFMARLLLDMRKSKEPMVEDGIAFLEKSMEGTGKTAENYIALADVHHTRNNQAKAISYYRKAFEISPDDTWTMYRVGRGMTMPEARNMFARLKAEGNYYGDLAKSKLVEMTLLDRVKEVY